MINNGKLQERYQSKQYNFLKGILLIALFGIMALNPVYAQSLKATGVSIFNAIYGFIGIAGAIALVLAGLNWALGNPIGVHDPKRLFFQILVGIAIAFASVAIIQFIKDAVGGSSDGIGSL